MFDRLSEITLALARKGGGGGGSTNYNDLDHKPKINNVELAGSLSLSDLGIQGAIDASQNASLQMLEDTVGWTGKNLLHIPSDAETSKNGVAYTYNRNADGEVTSVVAVRTSTSESTSGVKWADWTAGNYPYKGDVILSGCPSGGSNTSYCLELYDGTNRYYDTGDGVTIPYNTVKNGNGYIRIRIDSSYSGNAQTFYPMIRLASVTDDTYEPYHEDVDTAKANNSAIAPVENGSTTSQAYTVGSHAIRNGAFITWKNAKAQGETINDASDYTVGDVADSLIKQATFSGTTNTYGNLKISTNKIIVATKMDSASYFTNVLYDTNGDNYVQVRNANTGDVVATTAVSGTYYYI